jgi:hypothetical protein
MNSDLSPLLVVHRAVYMVFNTYAHRGYRRRHLRSRHCKFRSTISRASRISTGIKFILFLERDSEPRTLAPLFLLALGALRSSGSCDEKEPELPISLLIRGLPGKEDGASRTPNQKTEQRPKCGKSSHKRLNLCSGSGKELFDLAVQQ